MAKNSPPAESSDQDLKARRRTRCARACTACRKQKARCETLEPEGVTTACHRCLTLDIPCSLANLNGHVSSSSKPNASSLTRKPHSTNMVPVVTVLPPFNENSGISPLGAPLGADGTPKRVDLALSVWSFLVPNQYDATLDWSCPNLAINELLKRFNDSLTPNLPLVDRSLLNIIDQSQMQDLVDLFEKYYQPWLNFSLPPIHQSPLLDIIRCSIASRHLPLANRQFITPHLHSLAKFKISMIMCNPDAPSVETIRALMCYALWSPLEEVPNSGIRDGSLMIAVAVRIALNLKLNQVASSIISQPHVDPEIRETNEQKARLWHALCNMESVLLTGSGRISTAGDQPSPSHTVFPNAYPTTPDGLQKTQLRLAAEISSACRRGEAIDVKGDPGQLDQWHKNYRQQVDLLADLYASIKTMHATMNPPCFTFHMLKVHVCASMLAVCYHAMFELRYAFRDKPLGPGWLEEAQKRLKEPSMAASLVARIFRAATHMMEHFIEADAMDLTTTPDCYFNHILLASAIIVGIRLYVKRVWGRTIPDKSDILFQQLSHKFRACTILSGPDHPAAKCARFIETVLMAWSRQIVIEVTEDIAPKDHIFSHLEDLDPCCEPYHTPSLPRGSPGPTPSPDAFIDLGLFTQPPATWNSEDTAVFPEFDQFMIEQGMDLQFWNQFGQPAGEATL